MSHRPAAPSWPLVPFEQYMLDDDRPGSPMTFTMAWRLAGSVDAGRMQAAVEAAVRSHPLLGCLVRRGRWVPAAGGVPFRRVTAAAGSLPPAESIDPRREACLKVTLVDPATDGEETELRLAFHHAACDGVGAAEFSGDVFTAYRAAGLDGRPPAAPRSRRDTPIDTSLLADRGRLDRPVVPGVTWRAAAGYFLAEAARFFTERAVPIPCDPGGESGPVADPVPVRFTAAETAALRRVASAADATLNELLLAVLVSAINGHCAAAQPARRGGWIGVVQPVSMRPVRPARLPACNNIGYAFLRRPLGDCRDWRAVLPGLVQDARAVKQLGLAGCFNDALAVLGRLPEAIRRPLVRTMRPGTFVFSYLGDPVRRIPPGLRAAGDGSAAEPRQAAGIDLGGCRVVDMVGAPPPRPGTELGILASLFGQRLTLWLRPSDRLRGSASWQQLPDAIERSIRRLLADEPEQACPKEGGCRMVATEG